MALADSLRRSAQRHPDHEAIVCRDRRISYREFDELVDRTAAGLLRFGIARGDRVAAWLPNRAEFLHVYFACARLGAIFIPLNIRLGEGEVEYLLRHSATSLLFIEPEFAGSNYLESSLNFWPKLPALRGIVVVGEEGAAGTVRFSELAVKGDTTSVRSHEAATAADDVALVMYTSGTTGMPKGVMHTHRGLDFYGTAALSVGLFRPDDRVLIQVPLATTAGSIIQTLPIVMAGGTLVLMDVFKGARSLELIGTEKITCYVAPPTIYMLQLNTQDYERYETSTLRHLIIGAAPVPVELAVQIGRRMPGRLTNAYGTTEVGGLVTYMPEDAPRKKVITTCGVAIPGYEVRIVDEQRTAVTVGATGEVAVRGGSVMTGYYRDDAQTREVLDDSGWWYSGDLGTLDEDGYLKIVGRKKEMYIRGGFNIYPAEVEEVLQRHPEVLMCAVIGVPDPVLGERGRAVIVAKDGSQLTGEAVKQFCRGQIADFKIPDQVEFRSSMPLTGLGKIKKSALLEEAERENEGELVSRG